MTPCTEEALRLLEFAHRDSETFQILAEHPKASLAAKGFHAQQAVEKALKAVLTLHGKAFPRTHNLEELGHLVADLGIEQPFSPRQLRQLNPFAVEARYTDPAVPLVSGPEAGEMAQRVLDWATRQIRGGGA